MTEQLAPERTTRETKPRYEPPQVIDLNRMAQAKGGADCVIGSGNANQCRNGIAAVGICFTGTRGAEAG